ncbi:hypothetical protein [Microbacterium sp. EST19A]|uniref:hypothetical protein n=1 Tax=Microbacterium sp. EST19A TaxID=2862681 RepID=UPI001CBD4C03|nr:hypothetical protein [Microbacterium sp. EST19A]
MIEDSSFPASEYLDHRDRVGEEKQLWENNGWSIRGRDADTDYLFWSSPYLIRGLEGGSYRPGNFGLDQTLFVAAPADAPPELHDNDFIAIGWDERDHYDWSEVTVASTPGAVEWTTPHRTYLAAPPTFGIAGSHAGVEADIRIDLDAEPMWFTDPAESLDARANRWWIASGRASGELILPGRSVSIRDAHAVHERHIHLGRTHDPVRLLTGGGVCWYTASGEGLSVALLARPSLGSAWAQVTVGEQTWDVTGDGLSVRTTRTWLDPQTNMLVAQAWDVAIELPEGAGSIELALQAKARAYYTWDFLAEGQTMLYWWLCTGTAEVTQGDARHRVTDLLTEAHLNRTFSVRHDGSRNA